MVSAAAAGPGSQLVAIGSSAGGIEALTRVVTRLPADFPASIVIAQHLDPRRPSHLAEILGRHATLPIKIVEDHSPLEAGVIFVVPSNRRVEVDDGILRLQPAEPGAIAPSVDLLLSSAARSYGDRLIAVILTGTGSDGSAGAWNVKQAGGTVVIENPATAMFPSMPGSVSPSIVDAKADLDSIADVLSTSSRRPMIQRKAMRTTPFDACSNGSVTEAGSTSAPTSRRPSSGGSAVGSAPPRPVRSRTTWR